jgi:hypothetical protein
MLNKKERKIKAVEFIIIVIKNKFKKYFLFPRQHAYSIKLSLSLSLLIERIQLLIEKMHFFN